MIKPAMTGTAVGRSAGRRAFRVLALASTVAMVSGGVSALAQTATASAGHSTTQAAASPGSLEDIPGVTAGMTVDQLVEAGAAAITAGRLDDGRRILLAAVAREGRSLKALSQLAFAYERSAEQARAGNSSLEATAQADRFSDQAVDVYLSAAAAALDQEQVRVAEQFYNRILLHRPSNSGAILGLARIYALTDRRIQAIDRYKEYLASPEGRNDAKGYLELAGHYLEGTHWRLAMDQLARAQALQPDDPDVHMAFARAYQRGDRMPEAMKSAAAACTNAPDVAKYRNQWAELYMAQGDGEQASIEALRAIEFTRKALQAVPDDTDLLKELSRYYETYEKSLRSLLNEGKANPVVRVDLAKAIQEHAVVDRTLALRQALKVLIEVPAEGSDDVHLLEELIGVQRSLGLEKEARQTCRRLIKLDPANAVAARVLKETEETGEK